MGRVHDDDYGQRARERRRYEERTRYNGYVTGRLPKPPGSYHRTLEHDGKPSLWRRLKLALLRWWVSE